MFVKFIFIWEFLLYEIIVLNYCATFFPGQSKLLIFSLNLMTKIKLWLIIDLFK